MAMHSIKGRNIRTTFDPPPIPVRSADWCAVNDDEYDVDGDSEGFWSLSPVGHGATEEEAIADLLMQLEDE